MDGSGSLAALILGVMALMVVVPPLVLGGLAHRIWGSRAATGSAVILGVAVGATIVATTFYSEQITRPSLAVDTPPGFAHEWVVVLEDPSAELTLEWSGVLAPAATISVPAGGVVRVKALSDSVRGDIEVTLGSGAGNRGMMSRPAPAELGATRMVAFGFAAFDEQREPDLSLLDDAALVSRIAELEGG